MGCDVATRLMLLNVCTIFPYYTFLPFCSYSEKIPLPSVSETSVLFCRCFREERENAYFCYHDRKFKRSFCRSSQVVPEYGSTVQCLFVYIHSILFLHIPSIHYSSSSSIVHTFYHMEPSDPRSIQKSSEIL